MARQMSNRPASSSATTTLTVENPSSQPHQQQQTLVLRLSRIPSTKKKVTWKEGTVDNEFLQRKSSKKCCIFHKEKSFDEDDSDHDDNDCMHESRQPNKHSHPDGGGCCSKDSDVGSSGCEPGLC